MSKDAGELLEQFRRLTASDQRELFNLLLRELASVPAKAAPVHRKSIAEVAGKHRPTPVQPPRNYFAARNQSGGRL
jgi:hypothetical protein